MDAQALGSQIESIVADYVSQREHVALTIGVMQSKQLYIQGFGKLSDTQPSAPNARTVYEIGSITKVLTGTVLAALVNEQTVSLDDALRLCLSSESLRPLPLSLQALTLLQLVTHTAGLPRLPATLLEASAAAANPYAQYTAEHLYADLEQVTLLSEPGQHYAYSNLGMGLLGHVLSLKVSQPYEALVKNIICQPLGLSDTTMRLTPEQQQRLAPGHAPDGTLTSNWDFDVLAPAGAFRSTAQDLLQFLRANWDERDTQVFRALARSRTRYFEAAAVLHMGLAWHILTLQHGQVLYFHNGGTGGYVSFMGFDQEKQVGAVVLSNYGDALVNDASVDAMGVSLLMALAS